MAPWAPFAAAALITAAVLIVVNPWVTLPTGAVPAPQPTVQPAAEPAAQTPTQPAQGTTYMVQPGDSLWKIFQQQGQGSGRGKDWQDFLSSARALNELGDPDTIQPGHVLTIVPPSK